MTIQMVLKIPKEKLDAYKSVMIKPEIEKGIPCGEVTNIIRERSDGLFDCEVLVYKHMEDKVLQALQKHVDKLSGK